MTCMYQQQVDALHPTVADVLSQANNSCGHVAVITWMTLQFFQLSCMLSVWYFWHWIECLQQITL